MYSDYLNSLFQLSRIVLNNYLEWPKYEEGILYISQISVLYGIWLAFSLIFSSLNDGHKILNGLSAGNATSYSNFS
jgi:hypothetical protein